MPLDTTTRDAIKDGLDGKGLPVTLVDVIAAAIDAAGGTVKKSGSEKQVVEHAAVATFYFPGLPGFVLHELTTAAGVTAYIERTRADGTVERWAARPVVPAP